MLFREYMLVLNSSSLFTVGLARWRDGHISRMPAAVKGSRDFGVDSYTTLLHRSCYTETPSSSFAFLL